MLVLKIVFILFAAVPAMLLRGLVVSRLWMWFIVPLGVPAISIKNAMGFSILVSMLFYNSDSESKKKKWYELLISAFASPLFSLLFGYLIYRLIR